MLEDFAILDGDELARPVLLASCTRHAVSELTLHDLETGERVGEVPLPGLGSIGGLSERPEGGTDCWFGYTDHVTPSSVFRFDATAPAHHSVGDARRALSRCRRCTRGWSTTPRATARRCA